MKLLILGGTGKTGQQLIFHALGRGHEVTALVRNPEKLETHPLLTIKEGNVLDKDLLPELIEGKDAVISALGLGKSLKSNDFIYNVTSILIPAMQEKKVSRLIFLSAFGVGETFFQASWIQKLVFLLPLRNVYADKNGAEKVIRNSGLDWTLVYPVVLTDKALSGNYKAGEVMSMKGMPKVSRADVAHFMLNQLTDNTYVRKLPIVMS